MVLLLQEEGLLLQEEVLNMVLFRETQSQVGVEAIDPTILSVLPIPPIPLDSTEPWELGLALVQIREDCWTVHRVLEVEAEECVTYRSNL